MDKLNEKLEDLKKLNEELKQLASSKHYSCGIVINNHQECNVVTYTFESYIKGSKYNMSDDYKLVIKNIENDLKVSNDRSKHEGFYTDIEALR